MRAGSDRRLALIETVRAFLEGDPRIDGLVLIGSGAVGFRDELSDVDLIAVVEPAFDAEAVGDELAGGLRSALPLYRYIQTAPARAMGLHIFLLEGRLELDLSFISTSALRARSPRWRVVFDRSGAVENRMSLPLPQPPPRGEQAQFRYLAGCGYLWFGLKALQRGELFLAVHRLAEVRTHVTALACLQHFGTDEESVTRADDLPEAARGDLERLTCPASAPALAEAFRSATELLAGYDQRWLQAEFNDTEFAGLAEWLSAKYPSLPSERGS